jgi:anti-sigma B factor antagonist
MPAGQPGTTTWVGLEAPLRVEDRPLGGAHLIEVAGEADLSTTADFSARLLKISEDGDRKIVLDLLGLRFVDSTMVHAIISAAPRIRSRGGDMAIACSDSNVGRILEITAVDGIYRVVASTEEALAALGAA